MIKTLWHKFRFTKYEPRGSLASEAALNPLICHQLSIGKRYHGEGGLCSSPTPMSAFARGLNIFFFHLSFSFLLALPPLGRSLGTQFGFRAVRPAKDQESAPKIGLDMNHELQSFYYWQILQLKAGFRICFLVRELDCWNNRLKSPLSMLSQNRGSRDCLFIPLELFLLSYLGLINYF